MSYREQPAPGGLTGWVECIWSLETCEAIEACPVRPDGCIDILYSGGRVEVVGAMMVERRFNLEPHARRVGLRFRPPFALGQRGLPWGLVAAEAGYFDQAHMIRDFREFTGATPASVFSNTGGRVSG